MEKEKENEMLEKKRLEDEEEEEEKRFNELMEKLKQNSSAAATKKDEKSESSANSNAIELHCNICSELYDEASNRYPRLLEGCDHTICELCVNKLIENSKIQCPFDRIESVVPEGNPKYLKKDIAILEAIQEQKWKNKKQKQESDGGFAEEKKLGIPCDENKEHIAVFYCAKCDAHFCEMCSISIHSSNVLASHEIVKVTEKPEPLLYCPQHPTNIAELLCKDEKCKEINKLMCQLCQFQGVHKSHANEVLQAIFEKEKSVLIESVEIVQLKKEVLEDYREHMSVLSSSFDKETAEKYAEAREMIRKGYETFHEELEKDEKLTIRELDEFFEKNSKHCDNEIMTLNSILYKIECLKTKSDVMMKYGLTKFFENREGFNEVSTELQQLQPKQPEGVENGSSFKMLLEDFKPFVHFELNPQIKTLLVIGDRSSDSNVILRSLEQNSQCQYMGNVFSYNNNFVKFIDNEEEVNDNFQNMYIIYATAKTEIGELTAEIKKIQEKGLGESEKDNILLAVNGVESQRYLYSSFSSPVKFYNSEDKKSIEKLLDHFFFLEK